MTEEERDELLELADAYIERRLSAEKMAELEARLEDPEARRLFIDYSHDHATLHWDQIAGREDTSEPLDLTPYRRRRFPPLWQVFAAAALVCLLALLMMRPQAAAPTFATMELTESARWESGDLPTVDGARLGAGKLRLVRGLATVSFDSGVKLVLEAPTELELIDRMNCRLASGTVVADVKSSAAGFAIATPTAKVIDQGTRFAVNVHPATGATQTQVFEGFVEVEIPNRNDRIRLEAGQRNFVAGDGTEQISDGLEEGTWAAAPHPRSRDNEWRILTTAAPGADGYVWAGKPNDHVSDELLLLKNSIDLRGPHRKAFLRFDLSGIAPGEIVQSELTLRFAPTGWGLASHLDDSQFEVYGVTDDTQDDWTYGEMTWETAPANVLDSGKELKRESTVLLGSFRVPRGIQSGTFNIRGEKLTAFLNGDGNRQATLAIVRTTMEDRGGGLVHAIASARHPNLSGPELAVKVGRRE